jgi:hypothetical protein
MMLPAQVRGAYGINRLTLDGSGQTIAIVDAYDNPAIYQAVDAFDTQFGLTSSGPTAPDGHRDMFPAVDGTPGNTPVPVEPVDDAICAWLFAHYGDDVLGGQDGEADITAR